MVSPSIKMEKENEKTLRTKIVTYWVVDPEEQLRQAARMHVRRWSGYAAAVAALVAVCGLVATTFVWSKYGLSAWEHNNNNNSDNSSSSSADPEGRTAIRALHILGPVFLLFGLVGFAVACACHETRGRGNSTFTFDPGALDAVWHWHNVGTSGPSWILF